MKRYYVVVVGRYLDGPAHIRAIRAWMVADHEYANRCIGQKYDSHEAAQQEADRLNNG